ncbi:caspase, EACC1-associated type [Nonomuraea wenchangensis]|uniref:caspase, EACC1-associated type n=1 Tax=Nonomuraea wenchangensis TaxID=568860 RepID=UPI00332019AD
MRLPVREKSQAVLIGVGEYSDSAIHSIPAVDRNLIELRAALTHPINGGFSGERCEVLRPSFGDKPAARVARFGEDVEDIFLVYYCGHAARAPDGDLILTLSDTTQQQLEYTGLRIGDLQRAIMASRAQIRVLILDCCFSGAALPSILGDDDTDAIIDAARIEGALILASSAANRTSNAPVGEPYTAFSGVMIDILKNGISRGSETISLNDLYTTLDWRLRAEGHPAPKRLNNGTASDVGLVRNAAFNPRAKGPKNAGPSYMTLYGQVGDKDAEPRTRILALEGIVDKAKRGNADFLEALKIIAANRDLPLLFQVNAIFHLGVLGHGAAAIVGLKTITENGSEEALQESRRVLTLPAGTQDWLEQLKEDDWDAPIRAYQRWQMRLSDADLWGIHMARLMRAMEINVTTFIVAAEQLAKDLKDGELAVSMIRGLRRDRSLTDVERTYLDLAQQKLANP